VNVDEEEEEVGVLLLHEHCVLDAASGCFIYVPKFSFHTIRGPFGTSSHEIRGSQRSITMGVSAGRGEEVEG